MQTLMRLRGKREYSDRVQQEAARMANGDAGFFRGV